jgi:hypothetical protein
MISAVDQEDDYWRYQQNLYEFMYDDELASVQNKEESKKQLIQLLRLPTARNILKVDYRRNKNYTYLLNVINDNTITLIDAIEKTIKD